MTKRKFESVDPDTFYKKAKHDGSSLAKTNMGRRQNYVVRDVTTNNKPVSIKNKKAVKVKKIKKVKVSAKLKAKIMKVIDKKVLHVNGSYSDNFAGFSFMAKNRVQEVPLYGLAGYQPVTKTILGVSTNVQTSPWHFTLGDYMNAASVLFNKKPIPTDTYDKYSFASAGSFNAANFILDVRDSFSWYTFKNGTQHAINFTLCVCVPKRKGTTLEWDGDALKGQNRIGDVISNEQAFQNPHFHWVQSLAQDVTLGNTLQGYNCNGGDVTAAPSLNNPFILDMFRMPTESRTFNAMYKVETIRFHLQPGQEVKHKLQGPQKMTIDFSKQYQNDLLMNVQKYSRAVMGILYNSPVALASFPTTVGVDAVPGRWADQIDRAEAGFGLFVERSDHISIKVPEQAGFTFPTVTANVTTGAVNISGTQQVLNMRVPRQVSNNWFKQCSNNTNRQVVDLAIMNPQQPVGDRSGGGA